MLLSTLSVLVVAQSSSEIPEGLMNNPVYTKFHVAGYSEYIVHSMMIARSYFS